MNYFPFLLLLLGSFFLYSFNYLGNKEAPQEFKIFTQKENRTTFIFSDAQKIDQFCYYIGIDKNAEFKLSNKTTDGWQKIYDYHQSFPYSFRWHCQDIKMISSEIELKLEKGELYLGEIKFLYGGKTLAFTTDTPLLNNNQKNSMNTGIYGGMFFDEIYHGRTAYEIIHGLKIYENTHPYLGKLLIIPGIKAFGMTPFGWRFTNVIFGALLIVLAYFFALQLFKEKIYAFVSAFLMTYSFMHLAEARSGLVDTFGVFFVFGSYFFLHRFILKQKLRFLLLSGLFFGLASAVKWSAVFASFGYLAIALFLLLSHYPLDKRFQGMKLIAYGILSYIFLAVTVYFLTFFDIYLRGGGFEDVLNYQVNMYNYHSQLLDQHAYSSPWWSWPLDMKPMCATRIVHDGIFSSVNYFGNPAIFWTGTVALFYLLYVFIKKRTLEAVVILFAFLSLYLPYAFVGRYMFLYHFYYSVPFLILAIVYAIKNLLNYSSKYAILLPIYLAIVAILFLLFYPVLTGYEVPKSYVDNYLIWFNGWWL